DSWRRRPVTSPGLGAAQYRHLIGVGLGLFGLRTIAHIGREAERDQLWRTLLRVHDEQRARVVMLAGEPGTGKSRLAMSLGQRAHELGVAQLLRGSHGATVG